MSDTEVLAQTPETAAPEGPFTAPAPQPEVALSEAPPKTPPEPEVGPDKWWPSVESEDDLLAHERVAPRFEEREKQGYSRGVLDGKVSALETLDARSNDIAQAKNVASTILGRLNKAARDGSLTEDAIDNLLTDHGQTISALNRVLGDELKDEGRVEGYKEFVRSVASHLSDTQLETEFSNRIALALRGVKDDRIVPDFVSRVTKQAITEAVAPKDKKIAQLEATIEKMKATTRSNEGANLAPSQAGGGGRPTPEQYNAATREQRAEWRAKGIEPLPQ